MVNYLSQIVKTYISLHIASLLVCLTLFDSSRAYGDAEYEFLNTHSRFFRLLYSQMSEFQVEGLSAPDVNEDGGEGGFSLESYKGKFELPFPYTTDSYFRLGLDYELKRIDFDEVPTARTNMDSKDLHKASLVLGWGTFLNDELLVTGTFEPGLYTDFDDGFKFDEIEYYGEITAVTELNPGAQLVFGLRKDELFDSIDFYPLIGARLMSSSGRLHIDLTVPKNLVVKYNFTNSLSGYVGAWTRASEFSTNNDDPIGNFTTRIVDNRVGLGSNVWFTSWLTAGIEIGAHLSSEFEFNTTAPGQFRGDLDPFYYGSLFIGISP